MVLQTWLFMMVGSLALAMAAFALGTVWDLPCALAGGGIGGWCVGEPWVISAEVE
jgi:ABC-type nitrate/sulfonate/bicarbonate transport system substrate-binding protein